MDSLEVDRAPSGLVIRMFGPRYDLPHPARRPADAPRHRALSLTIAALRGDLFAGPPVERSSVTHMQAMTENGLYFSHAWSAASYTVGSLRALFTGVHVFQHDAMLARGLDGKRHKAPYLAELRTQHGVSTVNVTVTAALDIKGNIGRGFSEQIALDVYTATSKEVVDTILEQLDKRADGPLFIYSHIMDPHAPYSLGSAVEGASEKLRYLAEVAYVDGEISRLRGELRERNLEQRTFVVISADHAEAFGEHGHTHHATTVYQEMIHVPLIIEGPGIEGLQVRTPVTLLDLAPTVLSLFGVDTPPHFMGQSLVPFMRGESPQLSRPLAADSNRAIRAMLFEERWKAIVDLRRGTEELYDLQRDPGERINLAERPEARAYFSTLHSFFRTESGQTTSH